MQALEQAIEVLNDQYQACDVVKYDAVGLGDAATPEPTKQTFLVSKQSPVFADQ